jgi:hypothetical protein
MALTSFRTGKSFKTFSTDAGIRHLFFRILFISGIPSGLLFGILGLNKAGISGAIINGVLTGLVFGTLSSFILISLHISLSRKVDTYSPVNDFGTCQVRNIHLELPLEQAFALCLRSLRSVENCRVISQDLEEGVIRAKTGLNWKTWGDAITFKLIDGNGETEIIVSSRPAARSTLVDFGKNLDNVERIKRFLS